MFPGHFQIQMAIRERAAVPLKLCERWTTHIRTSHADLLASLLLILPGNLSHVLLQQWMSEGRC